jgi:hypothetical protein
VDSILDPTGGWDSFVRRFPGFGTYEVGLKISLESCVADTSISVVITDRADVRFHLDKNGFCQGERIRITNTTKVHTPGDFIRYELHINGRTYLHFPLDTTLYLSSLAPGIYDVRLVAQSGFWRREYLDTIRIHANPVINFGERIQTCLSITTLQPQDTGTTLWSDGSTGPTLPVTQNGRYWLTLTNEHKCTTTDSIEVFLNTAISTGLPRDTTHCGGLTLSVNYPNANYKWSTQEATREIHISTSGTYFVTLTDSICQTTDTITVTILEKPYLNLGNDTSICSGDTIILSVTEQPNVLYQWHTSYGEHHTGATINSFSRGTYHLIATHQINGCISEDTITVAVKDAPMINLGGTRLLCDTVVDFNLIRESGAASIIWTLPDGSQTHGYLLSSSQTGTHKVQVQYSNGCTAIDNVEIHRGDTRLIADFLLASAIKLGDTVRLINLSQSANSHHHTNLHYVWRIDNGFRSEEENPSTQFYREGEFNVTLTVYSDDSFCPATKQKAIYVSFDGLRLPKGERLSDEDGQQPDSIQEENFIGFLDAKLYPNPSDGNFVVHVKLSAKANVYALFADQSGRVLDQKVYRNQSEYILEYRFSHLRAGIYFLRLWSGREHRDFKIVVAN